VNSARVDRKHDRRRVRRAVKQALGGGHARLIRPTRWRKRPEQPVEQ